MSTSREPAASIDGSDRPLADVAVGRAVALVGPLEPRPGEGGTLFLSADTYTSVLVEGMKMECGEIDEPNPSAEHSSLKAGRRIEPLAVRCLRRSTAYAAAFSVILAGCVSDGVVPSPSSTAPSSGVSSDETALVLPLAAVLESSRADLESLAAAETVVLAQCMEAAGFAEVVPLRYVEESMFDVDRRYGTRTIDQAAELGYRPSDFAQQVQDANEPQPGFMNAPGYLDALLGPIVANDDGSSGPGGTGCSGTASIEIYGSPLRRAGLSGWTELLEVDEESYNALLASEAYRNANEAWSLCMASSGLNYASIQDALREFPFDASDPALLTVGPSDDEIRTATTDAQCQAEAGLRLAYFEFEAVFQTAALDERAALVAECRLALSRAVDRAQDILASSPSG